MSTKVKIDPGVCGLITEAEAIKTGRREVKLIVKSSCGSITKMFETLGEDFNSFEICLVRPGKGPLFDYASENFPVHVSCPAIAGIIKAAEVECGLALKKDASITFVEE